MNLEQSLTCSEYAYRVLLFCTQMVHVTKYLWTLTFYVSKLSYKICVIF